MADLVESVVRKIVTAIVIAGGLIAIGLWSRPGPARYQVSAAGDRVYRIDTKSGTVIGCEGGHCAIVLRRGQGLEDNLDLPVPPRQLAPPPSALPAPAPQATPAPTPAPAPAPR